MEKTDRSWWVHKGADQDQVHKWAATWLIPLTIWGYWLTLLPAYHMKTFPILEPYPHPPWHPLQGHGTRTTFTFSSLLLLWQHNEMTTVYVCIHTDTLTLSFLLTHVPDTDTHTHKHAQWATKMQRKELGGVTTETWTHWSSQEGGLVEINLPAQQWPLVENQSSLTTKTTVLPITPTIHLLMRDN